MADLSIKNYTNHIFQAVSIRLSEEEILPNAVVTECGGVLYINPLTLFNAETKIGYYQGYTVLDKDSVKTLCEGNSGLLETHDGISVYGFYDTVESAEEALLEMFDEQQKARISNVVTVPTNGYELNHESYGTSVTLGGFEKRAHVVKNCKIKWGEWFERSDSSEYCGRSYENWERSRNGYLHPIDDKKMAMAIIVEDDDLNNCSQSEPYEYLLLWSPSKKAWIRPSRKYRKILNSHILQPCQFPSMN